MIGTDPFKQYEANIWNLDELENDDKNKLGWHPVRTLQLGGQSISNCLFYNIDEPSIATLITIKAQDGKYHP